MPDPIIYLAGGIHGLSDAECKDWRRLAKRTLAEHSLTQTLDPMRRDYRGREHLSAMEIVTGDLADIDRCNVVLAMCMTPSWGTGMEIMYCSYIAKPVIAIVPALLTASPWLSHHTTLVTSLNQGIAEIKRRFQC